MPPFKPQESGPSNMLSLDGRLMAISFDNPVNMASYLLPPINSVAWVFANIMAFMSMVGVGMAFFILSPNTPCSLYHIDLSPPTQAPFHDTIKMQGV